LPPYEKRDDPRDPNDKNLRHSNDLDELRREAERFKRSGRFESIEIYDGHRVIEDWSPDLEN
jgi:hypothetical protein